MGFKEIEIRNFRGIRHLLLSDVKRVNLFVGRNNCGKSSVLDAAFLLTGFSNPALCYRINQFRDYNHFAEEDMALNFYNMDVSVPIRLRGKLGERAVRELEIAPVVEASRIVEPAEGPAGGLLSSREEDGKAGLNLMYSYVSEDGGQGAGGAAIFPEDKARNDQIEVRSPGPIRDTLHGVYVNSKFAFEIAVDDLSRIIEEKQEGMVVEILRRIEPKIRSIAVLKSGVSVDVGLSRLIPVNMLGDGIRKLLALATTLYKCRNGILFVDEIDNGLHFSSLPSLWKAVVEMAESLNAQVFATTHNVDSLRALSGVLAEERMAAYRKDVMCYSLRRLVTDELKAYGYSFEKFQYAINQEIEIR